MKINVFKAQDTKNFKVTEHVIDEMVGDLYNMVLPGTERDGSVYLDLGDGGEPFQVDKAGVVEIA